MTSVDSMLPIGFTRYPSRRPYDGPNPPIGAIPGPVADDIPRPSSAPGLTTDDLPASSSASHTHPYINTDDEDTVTPEPSPLPAVVYEPPPRAPKRRRISIRPTNLLPQFTRAAMESTSDIFSRRQVPVSSGVSSGITTRFRGVEYDDPDRDAVDVDEQQDDVQHDDDGEQVDQDPPIGAMLRLLDYELPPSIAPNTLRPLGSTTSTSTMVQATNAIPLPDGPVDDVHDDGGAYVQSASRSHGSTAFGSDEVIVVPDVEAPDGVNTLGDAMIPTLPLVDTSRVPEDDEVTLRLGFFGYANDGNVGGDSSQDSVTLDSRSSIYNTQPELQTDSVNDESIEEEETVEYDDTIEDAESSDADV